MKILLCNKFFFLKGGAERVFLQERKFLLNHGIKIIDFSMGDPRNLPSRHAPYFVSQIDWYRSKVFTW